MIYSTEADLHTLLDSLTDGEHIKATWVYNTHTVAVEGQVTANRIIWCDRPVRCSDGSIDRFLASFEAAREEEVTVTRDDEDVLHALLDSLEDGQEITAEWRNEDGSMSITGKVRTFGQFLEVYGSGCCMLRQLGGDLHPDLHSVTVPLAVTQRWEREDTCTRRDVKDPRDKRVRVDREGDFLIYESWMTDSQWAEELVSHNDLYGPLRFEEE